MLKGLINGPRRSENMYPYRGYLNRGTRHYCTLPARTAAWNVPESQGQPLALHHLSTSKFPAPAALSQVFSFHPHPLPRAYLRDAIEPTLAVMAHVCRFHAHRQRLAQARREGDCAAARKLVILGRLSAVQVVCHCLETPAKKR